MNQGTSRMPLAGQPVIIGYVSDPTAGETGGDRRDGPEVSSRHHPWRRATGERYLGGVAAGVSRWLELDPLFLRIGWALVAVFWPAAVVAYVALWLVLPSEPSARPLLFQLRDASALREALAAGALAVAAVLLLPDLQPGGSRSLQLGVVLVGVGLALLSGSSGTAVSPVPSDTPSSSSDRRGPRFTRPQMPTLRHRRDRPRQRPFLTPLAVSLMLVLVGVIAAAEWGGRSPVAPGTIVSLLMVLVGTVLVVSTRWGRARALLLAVPPLLVGWVAFSLTDVPRHPGIGRRTHTVSSVGDLREYVLGAGSLTVNAEGLALRPGQQVTLDAAVTAGALEIRVPHDAVLQLDGQLGLGQVEVWDDRIGAYGRLYDSGPTASRRIEQRMDAMAPLCYLWVEAPYEPTSPTPTPNPPPTVPEYRTPEGVPCEPEAAPVDPAVVTVRFEVGAGGLEVHRVEARN